MGKIKAHVTYTSVYLASIGIFLNIAYKIDLRLVLNQISHSILLY